MRLLSERVKITKVKNHSTASTATVESDSVDMAGYQGVLFIASLGTANAGNYMTFQVSTASTTGFEDTAGSKVASGTSDEDVWCDVYRPIKRYARCTVVRDGASSTLESVYALQYDPSNEPVDNTVSGTIIGEQHVSPSTGTA